LDSATDTTEGDYSTSPDSITDYKSRFTPERGERMGRGYKRKTGDMERKRLKKHHCSDLGPGQHCIPMINPVILSLIA